MSARKRSLGRGLDALLRTGRAGGDEARSAPVVDTELRRLPLEMIRQGRYQPRLSINAEGLEELAASIKAQGLVQPVVVRPLPTPGHFELIAGERRWRAAQLAGLSEIPALVRDVPDQAAMSMALIENIQREDLNPLDESAALARLLREFGMTHQAVADAVGRSRAHVTNLLRLMDLASEAKALLESGSIEMGHARALLSLEPAQQAALARRVATEGLSVRETERLVKAAASAGLERASEVRRPDPDVSRLEGELGERLGAVVSIRHGRRGKGSLVIRYGSLEELDGIIARFK